MQLIGGIGGGEKLDVLLNLLNMNTHKLFSAELNKALRLKYKSKSISALFLRLSLINNVKKPHFISPKSLQENGLKDCHFQTKKESWF
jgi:hypothetical protein